MNTTNTAAVTDEQIERAHKALMSELFLHCQPNRGDVYGFLDDHPELLRAALATAAIPAAQQRKRYEPMPLDWEFDPQAAAIPAEAVAEHQYATRLLVSLMEEHFPDRHPEWAPLPDLMGVLTQLDNMSTGLVRAAPRSEPAEPVSEKTTQTSDTKGLSAVLREWAGNYEEGSFDTEAGLMGEAAEKIEELEEQIKNIDHACGKVQRRYDAAIARAKKAEAAPRSDGLRDALKEALDALRGVVDVADRETVEFYRAHAAISNARAALKDNGGAQNAENRPQSLEPQVFQGGAHDGLRDALKAAYIAGATAVQNNYTEQHGDPEFGEAASDYAASVLKQED